MCAALKYSTCFEQPRSQAETECFPDKVQTEAWIFIDRCRARSNFSSAKKEFMRYKYGNKGKTVIADGATEGLAKKQRQNRLPK